MKIIYILSCQKDCPYYMHTPYGLKYCRLVEKQIDTYDLIAKFCTLKDVDEGGKDVN